ncbi:hypothetical protein F3K40_43250 [Streptomyces sp. LBUM 1478]|nr:hypothetical protein [Streptomyces sp. LBUM 1478]
MRDDLRAFALGRGGVADDVTDLLSHDATLASGFARQPRDSFGSRSAGRGRQSPSPGLRPGAGRVRGSHRREVPGRNHRGYPTRRRPRSPRSARPCATGGAGRPAGTRMRRLLQRVDGKTVRGARRRDGTQVHLLAAMTAGRQVIARREVLPRCEVCHKTNETSLTAMRSELILSSI